MADICSSILGVVLIGPSLDSPTCAAVLAALSHYQSSLQRLWALSEAGRLFAIRLQQAATRAEVAATLVEVDAFCAEAAATAAATRAEIAEMSVKLDRVLALWAAADDDDDDDGGGGGHRGGGL